GVPLAAVRDQFLHAYFNAGLMLINTNVWREEQIGRRAIQLIGTSEPPLKWLDQDALNMLIRERWRELDERWNVFPVTDQVVAAESLPAGELDFGTEQSRLER